MHHLINLAYALSATTNWDAVVDTTSVALLAITVLPVLIAAALTGALCTAVLGSAYGLSVVDAWLQDRVEQAGQLDA